MMVALDADVVVLTGVDWDLDGIALGALADALEKAGRPYPHRFALQPNTGVPTGFDVDGNGYFGDARDAQGYGRFRGEEGMAILSRLPIRAADVVDFSGYLWRDLPGALVPPGIDPGLLAIQRLSTTGHWQVPVELPDRRVLTLLAWHATPPVFDGPEDRNGRRNHDEAAFWLRLLAGDLPFATPQAPFVILGQSDLDPVDGDGRAGAMRALLTSPLLQDPSARGADPQQGARQKGDPALDTADYSANNGPGRLRVDYVLPSTDLRVTGAGVLWPAPSDPLAATAATASRHRPVWVDIETP